MGACLIKHYLISPIALEVSVVLHCFPRSGVQFPRQLVCFHEIKLHHVGKTYCLSISTSLIRVSGLNQVHILIHGGEFSS